MQTRTLTLRTDRLTELTQDELDTVAGAGGTIKDCLTANECGWSADRIYGICGELTYHCG